MQIKINDCFEAYKVLKSKPFFSLTRAFRSVRGKKGNTEENNLVRAIAYFDGFEYQKNNYGNKLRRKNGNN